MLCPGPADRCSAVTGAAAVSTVHPEKYKNYLHNSFAEPEPIFWSVSVRVEPHFLRRLRHDLLGKQKEKTVFLLKMNSNQL